MMPANVKTEFVGHWNRTLNQLGVPAKLTHGGSTIDVTVGFSKIKPDQIVGSYTESTVFITFSVDNLASTVPSKFDVIEIGGISYSLRHVTPLFVNDIHLGFKSYSNG